MSNNYFEEENIVEKKSTKAELKCSVCSRQHIDDFWHKRCAECRALDKKPTKKLVHEKKVFSGRTYKSPKTGKMYPSVTSIIHPEGIDFPEEQLKQYASRGTIVHKLIEEYHKSDCMRWFDPHNIPELKEHVKIVEKGNLKLKWEDCNYIGFRKKYYEGMKMQEFEGFVCNEEYQFAGRYDVLGTYKNEPAILDFKTASAYSEDKLNDYFMQLSAYAKTLDTPVKYLVIIPLSPKSPQGFLPPFVSSNIDKHFKDFLVKREEFKKIYDI